MTDSAKLNLVRSIYAEWERGDWRSTEWAHPEIEFVYADGPSPGTSTGVGAMAEAHREFLRAWEEWCVAAEEYREIDEERVLVLAQHSGRGKTSGVDVGQTRAGANLFQIRDGKVTRLVTYYDRDRALADLGLEPEADSA